MARQAVVQSGGMILKDPRGEDHFVIPDSIPKPGKLERSWKPGRVSNSRYTSAEMKAMKWKNGER